LIEFLALHQQEADKDKILFAHAKSFRFFSLLRPGSINKLLMVSLALVAVIFRSKLTGAVEEGQSLIIDLSCVPEVDYSSANSFVATVAALGTGMYVHCKNLKILHFRHF